MLDSPEFHWELSTCHTDSYQFIPIHTNSYQFIHSQSSETVGIAFGHSEILNTIRLTAFSKAVGRALSKPGRSWEASSHSCSFSPVVDFLEPRLRFPASVVGARGAPNVTLTYAQSILDFHITCSYFFLMSGCGIKDLKWRGLVRTGTNMNQQNGSALLQWLKGIDGCLCGPITSERQLISGEAPWRQNTQSPQTKFSCGCRISNSHNL